MGLDARLAEEPVGQEPGGSTGERPRQSRGSRGSHPHGSTCTGRTCTGLTRARRAPAGRRSRRSPRACEAGAGAAGAGGTVRVRPTRPTRLARTLAGAAAGLLTDRLLGEPSIEPHPVAMYGSLMTRLEGRIWQDSRGRGATYAATGIAFGAGLGALGGTTFIGTTTATYLSVAGRELADAARAVQGALAVGDLEGALYGTRRVG